MRSTAVLTLLLAAACGTLSTADNERLAQFQRNARLYYEGGKMEQCRGMIERGLALDPHNYQLQSQLGMVLLRQSAAETGSRQDKLLDEAMAQLTEVQNQRAPADHMPYQLLTYGIALQRVAMRHTATAAQLRDSASRLPAGSTDAKVQQNQADEHQALARVGNLRARDTLDVLLKRGELLLLAHKHLMEVATALGNYEEAFKQGDAFLRQAALEKAVALKKIREATKPAFEVEQRQNIEDLRLQEIETRSLLANIHYDRGDFAKAVQQLDVVLQLDPNRSADYYNRARALRELGRDEESRADFRRFLMYSELPDNSPKKADAAQALAGK